MKKLAFSIALTLCLVLALFAFASCGGKTKTPADTTAASTTEGSGGHVHVWDTEYTVDKAPTCTAAGTESIYCSVCRDLKPDSTRAVAALGHTSPEEGAYTEDTAATCTEPGSKSYHCTVCNESIPGTEVEIAAKGHVWAADYTVDQKETCGAAGSKSIHCTVCNAKDPDSVTEIPSDPNSHVLVEDVKLPTLLEPTGYRKAECSVCHTKTVDEVLTWEPEIFSFSSPSGKYYDSESGAFTVSKTIADIRGTKHFFPTTENPGGNDLWFEYSILWNPTLAGTKDARISVASFKSCELFGFYTRDDNDWNEYGGHFDMNKTYVYGSKGPDGPSWASYMATASDCILDPESGQPIYKGSMDSTITEDSYPAIGQYGWHRIGFRFHAEAVANTTPANKDGVKAEYTGFSELYIDGVKVWKVKTSLRGYWDEDQSKWRGQSYALIPNRAATFFANGQGKTDGEFEGAIEYEGVHFVDLDAVAVNMTIPKIADATGNVYVAIDDPQWTCGGGFVRQVERVENPDEITITLDDKGTPEDPSDDVTCSGKVWFKLAD